MIKDKPKNSYVLFGIVLVVIGGISYFTVVSCLYNLAKTGYKSSFFNTKTDKEENITVNTVGKETNNQFNQDFIDQDWNTIVTSKLPLQFYVPPSAKVEELLSSHALTLKVDQIKDPTYLYVYLTKYPNLSQFKDKAMIEDTSPYIEEKWFREFNDSTSEIEPTKNFSKMYFLKYKIDTQTIYYLIAHSKGKWSATLYFSDQNSMVDQELIKNYLVKIASEIKFKEIDPHVFEEYWSPKTDTILTTQ
jgi:hypothetical protein